MLNNLIVRKRDEFPHAYKTLTHRLCLCLSKREIAWIKSTLPFGFVACGRRSVEETRLFNHLLSKGKVLWLFQFNLIQFYLRVQSRVRRPITETAQKRNTNIKWQ